MSSFGPKTRNHKPGTRNHGMRILVYGFGPYRRFHDNVTERVLRHIAKRRWLNKLIFPVKFHRRPFIEAIHRFRPDLIIGLGQCSRGRLLRIETTAMNKRRGSEKAKARPVLQAGAPKLFTNFRPRLNGRTRRSRHAGDYVCNYSMYVILDFLQRRHLPAQYGFIHIPREFDPQRAATLLNKALVKIAGPGSGFSRACKLELRRKVASQRQSPPPRAGGVCAPLLRACRAARGSLPSRRTRR